MKAHHKGLIALIAVGGVGWYLFIRKPKTAANAVADSQGTVLDASQDTVSNLDTGSTAAASSLTPSLTATTTPKDPIAQLGLSIDPDASTAGTGGLTLGMPELSENNMFH